MISLSGQMFLSVQEEMTVSLLFEIVKGSVPYIELSFVITEFIFRKKLNTLCYK